MREVISCVLCALCMVYPDGAVSWNRQDCNMQTMQRVQNTWSIGTGLCQNARTQCIFPNRYFLDSGRKNNNRSSGINSKTRDCLSRIPFHHH